MNKTKQLDLFVPEGALPPSTNRGVTVSVHWLSITYFSDIKTAMTHFLREFIGYDIEDEMEWSEHFFNTKHGARGYQALYYGPEKVRLYGFPYDGQHCHLEIPGQVLELYGTEKAIQYLKSLIESGIVFRCTRIDIAFDHVPFTPKDCYDAKRRGNVVAKCHKNSWDWRQNAEGNTLYIGSKKSERFIRIYDKRGFTRLELVFKDRWAENFAKVITEISAKQWIRQCIGYLMDYVDFKQKDTSMYYRWWRIFTDNIEKITLKITEERNDFNKLKLVQYFERLLPTLYLIKYGCGININAEVDNAKDKLSISHIRRLNYLTKNKGR